MPIYQSDDTPISKSLSLWKSSDVFFFPRRWIETLLRYENWWNSSVPKSEQWVGKQTEEITKNWFAKKSDRTKVENDVTIRWSYKVCVGSKAVLHKCQILSFSVWENRNKSFCVLRWKKSIPWETGKSLFIVIKNWDPPRGIVRCDQLPTGGPEALSFSIAPSQKWIYAIMHAPIASNRRAPGSSSAEQKYERLVIPRR